MYTCIKCLFAKWDAIPAELQRIGEEQHAVLDLDPYVKKLMNARRRVVLVNNILQNAQVPTGYILTLEVPHCKFMICTNASKWACLAEEHKAQRPDVG